MCLPPPMEANANSLFRRPFTLAAVFIVCGLLSTPLIQAQITVIGSFNGANGWNPFSTLTLSSNGSILYGMSGAGVFSVSVSGGTPTVLANFNGSTGGATNIGGLTLIGSTLYGNTNSSIFSVPVGGGTPTVIGSVVEPIGGLALSSNGSTFYGASRGGVSNGSVFSLPVAGGSPAVLTSFNGSNGSDPYGGLTLSSDGSKLFGSCNALGGGGVGDVFSVPVSGGSPTLLGNFNGSNGANPYGGLTLIGANLYGTTSSGGTYHDGVVYSVPVGGGVITVLASFDGPDGADPMAGLTLSSDGTTLFGTTAEGGQYGDGEVFSVPVGGGTLGIVASFDSTDGQEPWAGLTLSPDGSTLYGSTLFGGANNDGVVFSVPAVRGTPAGPPAAPEPRSALLLVTGLVLFSARCRKRRS